MNNLDNANINALFKAPKVSIPINKPKPTPPPFQSQPVTYVPSYRLRQQAQPIAPAAPAMSKDAMAPLGLIDFGKNKIVKDDRIFQKNFRFKTNQALKGTLKRFADRKKVADLLWNKRGHGITKQEVKMGLRKLEERGDLRRDQIRAVRRKMKIY